MGVGPGGRVVERADSPGDAAGGTRRARDGVRFGAARDGAVRRHLVPPGWNRHELHRHLGMGWQHLDAVRRDAEPWAVVGGHERGPGLYDLRRGETGHGRISTLKPAPIEPAAAVGMERLDLGRPVLADARRWKPLLRYDRLRPGTGSDGA